LDKVGVETLFSQNFSSSNRWVHLARQIPWDNIVNIYSRQVRNQKNGSIIVNRRVIIGSLIIKYLWNLS